MPKRSTHFQRAVYYVKRHLANAGERVVESKFLIDRETGRKREVDVVLTASIIGHPVIVSMECRERRKRADVGFIEEMYGKHATLPTDRLILVSSSGFTEGARGKAAARGIELLERGSISDEAAQSIVGRAKRIMLGALDLTTEEVFVRLAPSEYHSNGFAVKADEFWNIFDSTGQRIGRVDGLVTMLRPDICKSMNVDELNSEWWQYQFVWEIDTDESAPIHVRQETPNPHLMQILGVCINGFVRFEAGSIELSAHSLGDHIYSTGTADVGGQTANAFLTQVGEGAAVLSIDLTGQATGEPPTWPGVSDANVSSEDD